MSASSSTTGEWRCASGHHCAWPTCRRFGVPATTRLSTYVYNDESDIDVAIEGILAAQSFFGV